ncbi:hypothetical protein LEMLEM_LOCUS23506 [Lemmus lemmus]
MEGLQLPAGPSPACLFLLLRGPAGSHELQVFSDVAPILLRPARDLGSTVHPVHQEPEDAHWRQREVLLKPKARQPYIRQAPQPPWLCSSQGRRRGHGAGCLVQCLSMRTGTWLSSPHYWGGGNGRTVESRCPDPNSLGNGFC